MADLSKKERKECMLGSLVTSERFVSRTRLTRNLSSAGRDVVIIILPVSDMTIFLSPPFLSVVNDDYINGSISNYPF